MVPITSEVTGDSFFQRGGEWLENRIKKGTVEGLRSALQVDPAMLGEPHILAGFLPIKRLSKAAIPMKHDALEEKLTF